MCQRFWTVCRCQDDCNQAACARFLIARSRPSKTYTLWHSTNQASDRIAELTRHASEGGFGLDASAPQVISERRKLERVEKELARLTELREVRTTRWQAAARLDQTITDWLMRGIPASCVIERQPMRRLPSF